MHIFSGCRPKPLGAAAPTKSTLALHDSWMAYRCGHQAAVSGDGHQDDAAPTAEVINTHLASQVQQNAFTPWQRRVYALPPWRTRTCQPTLRSRSALAAPPEYASGPCSPPMLDLCLLCFRRVGRLLMPGDTLKGSRQKWASSCLAHNGKCTCDTARGTQELPSNTNTSSRFSSGKKQVWKSWERFLISRKGWARLFRI